MRTVLVLMTVLCLSATAQEFKRPIPNLPAPWVGRCFVATPKMNVELRAMGLAPNLKHECSITMRDRLDIVLTMPALGAERVPVLTITHAYASGDAPMSLHFPGGVTFTAPPIPPHYDPQNNMRLSLGWKGREAQTILQRMMTAPSVQVRYQTATFAVTLGIEPAGMYNETFVLAHFATAWKKLTDAIYALPALDEEAPPRPRQPKTVTPHR